MNQNGCKLDCTTGLFKRLHYFHGMLLAEQDFRDEQAYFREKLKLHNRLLHGYGIVVGLGLTKEMTTVDPHHCEVYIHPGVALDCDGNEIVVCKEHPVGLKTRVEELKQLGYFKDLSDCSPPAGAKKLYVGIRYCECQSDPAPQYTSECSDDQLQPEFSRVREGFRSRLFTEKELPPCPDFHSGREKTDCGQNDDPCEGALHCKADPHYVILGCIEISGTNLSTCADINPVETERKFYPARFHGYSDAAFLHWETAKFAMLATASRVCGWKDISVAIGRTVKNAINLLESLEMDVTECQPINECMIENLLQRAQSAWLYAPVGSQIELVCDASGECVLFPLRVQDTSPPQELSRQRRGRR